jgi:phospholipid transport system substrate-binding protein
MFRTFLASMAFWMMLPLAGASSVIPPDQLIYSVTQDVLAIIQSDEAIRAGDSQRIVALVDEKVLPHFNFRRMTALAVGRDWRQATPEQQDRLVSAFRTLLVRTYSNALTQYREHRVEYRPFRMAQGDTDVTVRTAIQQPGAQPVGIDYNLSLGADGWKVYDVTVANVSLVINYRGTFAQEVRASGIDGLIASLERRNQALLTSPSSATPVLKP